MKKILFLFLIFFTMISSSCAKPKLPKSQLTIIRSNGTKEIVNAEIAIKEDERNFGFMERKSIPDGTGMLFVFESDQILSFWMKNTPHPLSIAYIDSKGYIRNIYDMTPFSLSPIISTVSVRYALEVPQGWFQKCNIQIGDKLTLPISLIH